uniref:AGRL2-4 GAIN subdomain A domain-containing protein n=1 Tax=Gopherus agassizii TaxID=38772 RepID=A0A452GHB2_9SAUR
MRAGLQRQQDLSHEASPQPRPHSVWDSPAFLVPGPEPPRPRSNLLRVGSALLDPSNKRHWELIQQTEGGTAWLLKRYQDYASTLGQNLRQTYLNPFTLITPNIGEGVVAAWGRGRCMGVWLSRGGHGHCMGGLSLSGPSCAHVQ